MFRGLFSGWGRKLLVIGVVLLALAYVFGGSNVGTAVGHMISTIHDIFSSAKATAH